MAKKCIRCQQSKEQSDFVLKETDTGHTYYTIGCRDCINAPRRLLRELHRAKPPLSRQERFEQYFAKTTDGSCWLWTGGLLKSKHGSKHDCGQFNFNATNNRATRKNEAAYRSAWKIYRGDIPDGMSVCHKCDNRLCVNPDHLFLGTHAENMADMMKKERHPVVAMGSKHAWSKLTEKDVLEIRSSKEPPSVIAKRFNVTQTNINFIRSRKTWAHVKEIN